jgi:hypothetical protein
LIEKGDTVTAEEIVKAGIFPLSSAVNLKLFVNKYYMEHGRVYMVKALEAQTEANRANGFGRMLLRKSTRSRERGLEFETMNSRS